MLIYMCVLMLLAAPYINKGYLTFYKRNNFYFYFVVLFLVSALNYGLGFDTMGFLGNEGGYYQAYKEIHPIDKLTASDFYSDTWQPGFVLLFSFIKSLSSNYLIYQIIHAFIINLIIFYFVRKNTAQYALCLFFYCLLNFFDYNFEIQRESFSIVVGLLMFQYLERNNGFRSIIISIFICVLAFFLIHRSSFILLCYPLLKNVKISKKFLMICCLVTTIIQILWVQYAEPLSLLINIVSGDVYKGYISTEFTGGTNFKYTAFKILTNVIIPYICVFCSFKLGHSKYLIFAILSILFERLTQYTFAFHRLYGYFAPFYWIVLTDSLVYLDKKYLRSSGTILRFILVLIVFIFIIGTYHYDYFAYDDRTSGYVYEEYIPYKSVLESGNSY